MKLKEFVKLPILYLASWIIWFCVLWYLSSNRLPNSEDLPMIPFQDKILHWGYFGIGSALLTTAYLTWKKSQPSTIIAALLVVSGVLTGLLDEWHQSWIPARTGNDLGDFIADSVGSLCGVLGCCVLFENIKKLTKKVSS